MFGWTDDSTRNDEEGRVKKNGRSAADDEIGCTACKCHNSRRKQQLDDAVEKSERERRYVSILSANES